MVSPRGCYNVKEADNFSSKFPILSTLKTLELQHHKNNYPVHPNFVYLTPHLVSLPVSVYRNWDFCKISFCSISQLIYTLWAVSISSAM